MHGQCREVATELTKGLTSAAAAAAQHVAAHRAEHLSQLCEFLSIPSVSTLPEHHGDVRRAADWLAEHMRRIGFQRVDVMPTAGHPVVYGEWRAGAAASRFTLLVYGHYDVQPVDPLHMWTTPPFEPQERAGRLYARGASDDKGQIFMHLKAVEAWLATAGSLPVDLKVIVEGEEEVGSPNLPPFLLQHRDMLRADAVVISDTPLFRRGVPALCYGLRGLAGMEVRVQTARSDLHSGLFGGAAPNALHVLAELMSGLHDRDGRVAVAGFYDRVSPLSEAERAAFARLPFDEEAFRADLGVGALVGEPGYSALERLWARPTLELNGLWGGFQGEGSKTVIPCEAHAKITCRLVPDQDPEDIAARVAAHLRAACPPSATVEVTARSNARPVITSLDHPAMRAAARALRAGYGREPDLIRMGGSIPVVETFANQLGLPAVLMGFGLPDENFHAPDEHFHLENFDLGLRSLVYYLAELAAGGYQRRRGKSVSSS